MKRTKLFSALSVISLLVASVFIVKANNKFSLYTGAIYTVGQTVLSTCINGSAGLYTNTVFSPTQATLNGIGLYWISTGVSKKLYQ